MRVAEVELDHAFAESLDVVGFLPWLLAGGRFSRYAESAVLLREEQSRARKALHWWKHWWCRLPDGTESETDVFLVFEAADGLRFALHIENKPTDGILKLEQASRYRRRAALKANDPKWLSYIDFETIILAPRSFLEGHEECVAQFDRAMSYESVASFVPLFGKAVLT
jgi:hypothetical protein